MPIQNVSDTARWVAIYRAMETERSDAIFKDPYARKLAGESGEEIVNNMKRGKQAAWAMIVRTAVMDEIIRQCIAEGADTIVNLAAGLDARPWRMDLPATLHWLDVDLPSILNHKTEMLKDERTRCRYEAVTMDLRDRPARKALFTRIGAGAKKVIVIAEGLLIYLEPEQVADLADDLSAVPSFRWWLIDIASPELVEWMKGTWGDAAQKANAPFRFAPKENTAFFLPHGWKENQYRNQWDEGKRLNRMMPNVWLWTIVGGIMGFFASKEKKERFKRFSGIALLERA